MSKWFISTQLTLQLSHFAIPLFISYLTDITEQHTLHPKCLSILYILSYRHRRERRTLHPKCLSILYILSYRHRRAAHITPKTFLSFINVYKKIYGEKKDDIGDSSERMTTGLAKLHEASMAVQRLREELSIMEKELEIASEKAEKVRNPKWFKRETSQGF